MLTRKPRHHRSRSIRTLDPAAVLPIPPAPPPGVSVATVYHANEGDPRFVWIFASSFDDAHAGEWTAADFAFLVIGGQTPTGIDEVVGSDGTITLLYPLQNPDDPGLQYAVPEPPGVLVFDGGLPLASPQSGPVSQV